MIRKLTDETRETRERRDPLMTVNGRAGQTKDGEPSSSVLSCSPHAAIILQDDVFDREPLEALTNPRKSWVVDKTTILKNRF
ncbi:MAG: hypothetical protein C4326_07205 [Ignavibacteria bacterium]